MRRVLGILLLVTLVGGGCGVRNSKPFTASGSAGCFKSKGFKAVTTDPRKVGFIAGLAENGGLSAVSPTGNRVTIAFTGAPDSVASTERAFKLRAPKNLRPHISDILRTDRNAVLVWTVTPDPDELDTAMRCLRA